MFKIFKFAEALKPENIYGVKLRGNETVRCALVKNVQLSVSILNNIPNGYVRVTIKYR